MAGYTDSTRNLLAVSLIAGGLLALVAAFGLMVARRPRGAHQF
ncbi:MAG: hypothetical protein QM655_00275 [Nocardioidaceae bacterium]